jgi:hypothetical protein
MEQRLTKEQMLEANRTARQMGYGKATEIIVNPNITQARVVHRQRPGYRKKTTGEYVPNSYRSNFGWKNTYYQCAETVVEVPTDEYLSSLPGKKRQEVLKEDEDFDVHVDDAIQAGYCYGGIIRWCEARGFSYERPVRASDLLKTGDARVDRVIRAAKKRIRRQQN